MTQAFAVAALLALLSSLVQSAPARFDEQPNGPSLNGAPVPALGSTVRAFAVESVELPDGSSVSR